MAKNIQQKIRDLSHEYNLLLDRLETMEKKAPYNGWRDRDGYMDYLEGEMAAINEEIERLQATA